MIATRKNVNVWQGNITYLKILVVLGNDVLWSYSARGERGSTILELDQELAGIYSPHY